MNKFYPDKHLGDTYQLIYVESTGDYWLNREEVISNLYASDPTRPVLLHFTYQAIGIEQSGLLEVINQYTDFSGRSRNSIFIHTPNREEDSLGFTNIFSYPVCDEFVRCRNYWTDNPSKPNSTALRFGHFVGRSTTPRIKFFYDIQNHNIQDKFLLSKLQDNSPGDWNYPENNLDDLSHWFDTVEEQTEFSEWYKTQCVIPSIDNLSITDQYDIAKTARLNMVNQSWRYHVDIVFESLTVGNTFAPTEKLIRSLIAEKPFIVYAPKHYLQRLQRIGFKTFNEIWSEEYDNFDFVERYNKILNLTIKLAKLSDKDFLRSMESAQEICKHNKQVLKNINVDYHGSEQQWINNTSNLLIS